MEALKNKILPIIKSQSFLVFIVFAVFGAIVLLQHHYAWFCHDDYAYGSLSYAYDAGINGHSFTPAELGNFLGGHYVNWGGRILYFAIDCIILSLGVHAWRIIQTIVIVLIFFCIYKITLIHFKNINRVLLAVISVSMYGLIGIMVTRDGILWVTASVLYLFPFLPFFCFILFYKKYSTKITPFKALLLCCLIFLSTFSYEQISVAAVLYVAYNTIYNRIKNKKINALDILLLLVGLTGFAILMLAPGNSVRTSHPTSIDFYSLPLFERIFVGTKNVLSGFFSNTNSIFLFIFLSASVIATIENFKRKERKSKVLNILNSIALFSTIIVFVFNSIFSANGGYYSVIIEHTGSNRIIQILCTGTVLLQCLLIMYSFTYFLYKKATTLSSFAICAIATLGVMTVAPYFPARAMLVFELLTFPIIIYTIIFTFTKKSLRPLLPCICSAIALISLTNLATIIYGYSKNDPQNKYNDKVLTDSSTRIKSGETINKVTLHKLNDPLYGSDQPYHENRDYILNWMKKYYDLPQETQIEYINAVEN